MKTISAHNKLAGAVWAVVRLARTTTGNSYRVVKYPELKRWLLVDQNCKVPTNLKIVFRLRCYKTNQEHRLACHKASSVNRKWQETLYRQFKKDWDGSIIPKDNTREQFLKLAAIENNAEAIRRIVCLGGDVNYGDGFPIRMAIYKMHWDAVLALIKAGAAIELVRVRIVASTTYKTKREWLDLLTRLVRIIEQAKLDEKLPVFNDLAAIAQDPDSRPKVLELTKQYPGLLAKIL